MFHIPSLKEGIKAAGFIVTEGADLTAKDLEAFYHWAHFVHGLSKEQASYGLSYPSTVSSAIPGHPNNPNNPNNPMNLGSTVEPVLPNPDTTLPVTYPAPTPNPQHFNDNLPKPTVEALETPTEVKQEEPSNVVVASNYFNKE